MSIKDDLRAIGESPMTDALKQRVLDPNREVKDFDDAIELGMYGAYELGNHDDFKFLEQFKGIEMKLEENPSFTKFTTAMSTLRKDVMEGTGLQSLVEVNKALQNNPVFTSILDGQNKLRENAFNQLQPNQEFSDALKRITQITNEHKRVWNQRTVSHKQEVENLEVEITKLTPPLEFKDGGVVPTLEQLEMQVEVLKSERDMHSAELDRTATMLKKIDAIEVSDWYKKHEKHIQQHIIRNETKKKVDGGVSKKQQQKLDDIYKMWIKYSSMKKGKLLKGDMFDLRKRRYTNEECYNHIKAELNLTLENSVIAKYIKDYKK
ncbi:MAG: hypothetical protein H8E85_07585 [Candidatus Marinimicrobia bacterium]|nr:hypothetical protein [Candidatus Neomarinimicrobiota bacterium]